MSFIGKIIDSAVASRRKRIHDAFRKNLKNETPSIIANNCVGTMMYHHLGLRFMSPTVNLWFKKDDYLTFLCNLREYLNSEMTEVIDSKYSYPIGKLSHGGKDVRIYGTHYKSFDELKEKWNDRKARTDFENLFIVLTTPVFTKNDAEIFDALPYENKLVIAGHSDCDRSYIIFHKALKDENYDLGNFVQYKRRSSVKKPMDDIDYVRFLNG